MCCVELSFWKSSTLDVNTMVQQMVSCKTNFYNVVRVIP